MSDTSDKLIPWGLHPVNDFVFNTLNGRAQDYGYTNKTLSKTAWIRFFSNGIPPTIDLTTGMKVMVDHNGFFLPKEEETGKYKDVGKYLDKNDRDGFLMFGVNGFKDTYGFSGNGGTTQVLGYDANGVAHTIDMNAAIGQRHRPAPHVVSVDVGFAGGQNNFAGSCRKAEVKWKCYSLDQINYLEGYFLSPRVTCCLEWGWNKVDGRPFTDLIDLSRIEGDTGLRSYFNNAEKVMEKTKASAGEYDAMLGYVTEYGYSVNKDGSYDCTTTIVTVSWLFDGVDTKSQVLTRKVKEGKEEKIVQIENFSEFNKLSKWVDDGVLINNNTPSYPNGRYFTTDNKFGKSDTTSWIRMDYFIEVLNFFFEKNMNFINESTGKPETWNSIDISDVFIGAHPGIKSVDPILLIPNQFAPKYISEDSSKIIGTGELKNISFGSGQNIEDTKYFSKFKSMQKTLESFNFSSQYDDLFTLIQGNVNNGTQAQGFRHDAFSFPIFEQQQLEKVGKQYLDKVGYMGRLADLYLSVSFIKSVVEESNTTTRGLLQSIVTKISQAMCGVVDLRVKEHHKNKTAITVYDAKLCPSNTPSYASTIPTIQLGAASSAYLLGATVDIKMSQAMANQIIMTAGNDSIGPNDTVAESNVGDALKFASYDRLFQKVTANPTATSTQDSSSDKQKVSRSSNDKQFIPCKRVDGGQSKVYYLIEPDQSLMQKIATSDKSPQATYMSAAIMPGARVELEFLGISGFNFLGQFRLANIPTQYNQDNAIWQICDVKHNIEGNMWKTTVGAQVRPISTTQ